MTDPGALALDWDRWCEVQESLNSGGSNDSKLRRGDEIKVTEEDACKLSGDQIDAYLDWFEKTWIDEERARKHPRGYPEQLLDMFPTGPPGGSTDTAVYSEKERQEGEEALETKLRTVQASLKPRQVTSDEDASKTDGNPVNRIGSYYKRYRKMEDLSTSAKAFHQAAANLVAIKLHSLLIAVTQIEHKLLAWRKQQLKEDEDSNDEVEQAEYSGQALTDQDTHISADEESPEGKLGKDKPRVLQPADFDSDLNSRYEEDTPL